MFKIFTKFRHLPEYACIIILWALVVFTNYTPGTWLIGWDNLLPEMNFSANIWRTLTPVWQESQGFGLLGGIAHASEITRQIILFLFSFILPQNTLRYAWTFAMLLVGALGCYHLVLSLITRHFKPLKDVRIPSLAASVYYIFNPATLQNFYVPLESFSSFYGFLPWILLHFIEYLYTFSTKSLWKLGAVLILASSAFHVQTMFIVLCMFMAIFVTEVAIKLKKKSLFPLGLLALCIIAATAFWFFPVAYFATSSADATILSRQNQLATTESHLLNKSFGGFTDIIFHRGYWLEYTDITNNKTSYMFDALRTHLYNPFITIIQAALALISITGIIITTRQKQSLFRWSFLAATLLIWGMLSAGTGVLGLIFTSITESLPLFHQMFRVTFTKWSVLYGLLASIGIGTFIYYLQTVSALIHKRFTVTVIAGFIALLSLVSVTPIFEGELIYDQVQLRIPDSYFSLYSFFDKKPIENRILMLPAHSFWDWRFHNWGYRGSGFIWYGLKQPIIDRNFDVWSKTNETFYSQLNKAIYDDDLQGLAKLFQQYDVSYIVLDESVTIPGGNTEQLRYPEIKQALQALQFNEVWQDNFLHVYETPNNDSFISSPPTYIDAGEPSMTTDKTIFKNLGNYISPEDSSNNIKYPFTSLMGQNQDQLNIVNNSIRYKYNLTGKNDQILKLPALIENKPYIIPVTVTYAQGALTFNFIPLATIDSGLNTFTLDSLGTHTIIVENQYSQLFVDINNQVMIINQDKPRTIFLQLFAGQDITVTLANAQNTQFINGRFSPPSSGIQVQTIASTNWDNLLKEHSVNVSRLTKVLELVLPTLETNINFDNTIPQETRKCDVLNRGVSSVDRESGTLLIQADDRGAICHGWELDQALTTDLHLLRISGNNSSGRPLKVFIEHLGKKMIVQEFLTPKGSYDAMFTLSSWNDSSPSTYALNVETRSMGGERALNEISAILQYPLPLSEQWLTDISLTPDTNTSEKQNDVVVSDEIKMGTYSFMFTGDARSKGVVVLEEAYDPGWIAIGTSDNLIHSNQILEHTKYNGWSNAWLVPQGKWHIRLLYLPQLLNFAGWGLLVTAIIFFIKNKKTLQKINDYSNVNRLFSDTSLLKKIVRGLRLKLKGSV